MNKKRLVIDADRFSDLEGFYDEIDRVITADLEWQTGHNLDAFNDLLGGGFGVYEPDEPVTLIWKNSAKSKVDLSALRNGEPLYMIIINIILQHAHIEFIEG